MLDVRNAPEPPIAFVIDNEPALRSSIRRLLRAQGYRVETHSSTAALFESGRPHDACCIILDVHTQDAGGLEFKRRLDRHGIRVPIIYITGCGSIALGIEAMKEGAVDFLTVPFDKQTLLSAVQRAIAEDSRHLQREQSLTELARRFASLTARERDVCLAVTAGLLNKQVGAQFGVSEKTIKVHRHRVMEKMRARSLPELVRMIDALEQVAVRV